MANRPAAEVDVSVDLARRLIDDRFPEFAGLPLTELSRGWDNTNLRLGDDHLVRLPHRRAAADLILHEQRWLPELAPRLPLAVPSPTHNGRPTDYYPWHWSIVPWLPGADAATGTLLDPAEDAHSLGRFLARLHVDAPADAPHNPYRGVPIATRAEPFETNRARIGPLGELPELPELDDLDAVDERIAAEFEAACSAPPASRRVWLHGDLHTRNILVDHGRLAAVIDWGDLCAGDPATDLAVAFMLVPDHLDVLRGETETTDADWRRARGWAAHFALAYLANSDDEPIMRRIAVDLIAALLRTAP